MIRESVCAVILAAGCAKRMGQLKQLLPLGDKTILEHVIEQTLAGDFTEVYAVIGHKQQTIRDRININDDRFHWLINESYQMGQSTSLRTAINQLKSDYQHLVVFLGDLPFIKRNTIRTIYKKGQKIEAHYHEPFVIRPTYQGKIGHPVFIGNISNELFSQIHGDSGLKSVFHKLKNKVKIEVDDAGIILDIDTPEQYEQLNSELPKFI